MHDLIIWGGTIADGSGMPTRVGDVAIEGNRIVAVGQVEGTARREIEVLQKTWEMLEHLPRPRASEAFTHRTLTEVDRIAVSGERKLTAAAHALCRLDFCLPPMSAPFPVCRSTPGGGRLSEKHAGASRPTICSTENPLASVRSAPPPMLSGG